MSAMPQRHVGAFLTIVSGTVIGIAGIDLVLPAVPGLPALLGGDLARAQLVLASFTAGSAAGLMLFGALGARFDQRRLLVLSLLAYAVLSLSCRMSTTIDLLIGLRFLQGASGAAAAVFAPGLIRRLYGDDRAVGAMGVLGSVESLVPALAPIVGLWLLNGFGWRASFDLIAGLAVVLAGLILWRRDLPASMSARDTGGYARLLHDATFLRYAISHACTLGALLVVVFGAPTVFTVTMGGSLRDFIVMQGCGVASFIIASNQAGRLTRRHGAERMILIGTGMTATGACVLLGYALLGGRSTVAVTAIFLALNLGLALRGPAGFHRAIVAARDDARGAALAVVAILLVASLGTAAVAPFIALGLVPLATGAAAIGVAGVLLLWLLPPLRGEG